MLFESVRTLWSDMCVLYLLWFCETTTQSFACTFRYENTAQGVAHEWVRKFWKFRQPIYRERSNDKRAPRFLPSSLHLVDHWESNNTKILKEYGKQAASSTDCGSGSVERWLWVAWEPVSRIEGYGQRFLSCVHICLSDGCSSWIRSRGDGHQWWRSYRDADTWSPSKFQPGWDHRDHRKQLGHTKVSVSDIFWRVPLWTSYRETETSTRWEHFGFVALIFESTFFIDHSHLNICRTSRIVWSWKTVDTGGVRWQAPKTWLGLRGYKGRYQEKTYNRLSRDRKRTSISI